MKGLLEREIVIENEVFENEVVPDTVIDDKSICTSCIHTGHCVYQGRSSGSIITCDEFESKMAISRKIEILPEHRIERNEGELKGLCANCDYRNTCMFADSVSGIWHCEEYR